MIEKPKERANLIVFEDNIAEYVELGKVIRGVLVQIEQFLGEIQSEGGLCEFVDQEHE